MTTVKDVADLAGVSTATVSRVLNNSSRVTEDTRARVMQAMQQLDYRPNHLARNLRKQTTQTLGVIIPDIQNQFFVSIVRGIEDIAFSHHHILYLCNSDDSCEREQIYINTLLAEGVAGVIICVADEVGSVQAVQTLVEHQIPVVALDRELPDIKLDSVLADNVEASRTATDYLLEAGHTRIGLISGPPYLAPGRERRQGYEIAMNSHGISIDPSLIKITDFSPEEAQPAIKELLDMANPPSALLACSGLITREVLKEVSQRGMRIPEDITLIGYDDTVIDNCLRKTFPIITQNTYDLGRTTAQLLFRRLEQPTAPIRQIRLPTQFVIDPASST